MASNGETAIEWLDDDTRVDVYAIFVLESDVPNSMINEVLEKNEDDADHLLWLADSYDKLPEMNEEQRTTATEPPIDGAWRSPFIGRSIEDAAQFVKNAPKPLCKVFFGVLEKDSYTEDDTITVCKIVNGEVQKIPCTTEDVATFLIGHDRDTWEESYRRWREEGLGL